MLHFLKHYKSGGKQKEFRDSIDEPVGKPGQNVEYTKSKKKITPDNALTNGIKTLNL